MKPENKLTVDSTKLNETASGGNASRLLLVGRLVVVGHGLRLALVTQNRPRVSRVGLPSDIEMRYPTYNNDATVRSDETEHRCAAGGVIKEGWVGTEILVGLQESLLQCSLVISRL